MSRLELLTLLIQMLAKGQLTYVEARTIIFAFDRGTLPPIAKLDMAALLLNFLGKKPPAKPAPIMVLLGATTPAWEVALLRLNIRMGHGHGHHLSKSEGKAAVVLLRADFEQGVQRLAAQVFQEAITPQEWQAGLAEHILAYSTQAAVAGAGRVPGPAVQARVTSKLIEQPDYLLRFTLQMTSRDLVGRPMTAQAISARATLYGGVGWGSFFQGQAEQARPGYVERWITRDDNAVCRVCKPRHRQIFLVGQGPMPGWDCLGSCRCKRVQEFAPTEFVRLLGGAEGFAA
jgi:hypothetical protein